MRPVRSVLLAVVLTLCAAALPGAAGAEPLPPYERGNFPNIQEPEGPEEFSWEVTLHGDQELRQIDDRSAAVYYTDPEEHLAFEIGGFAAHDAVGATVPTTLAVTQPNILTLTVHHRAGNPAAGGAPFDYPIIAGEGWEGGFQSVQIKGPPDEAELRAAAEAARRAAAEAAAKASQAPPCAVPDLSGRTVRAARRMLNRAHCALGPVRGERSRGARVVRQYRGAGKSLPAGTEVGVKVLRP